jgi:hypothetical protein
MDASPANLQQFAAAHSNTSLLNTQFPNPFYGVLPITQSIAQNKNISYGQLIRNWPLFTQLQQEYLQVGHYRSDQLQVKLEKRVLGGAKSGVFTYVLSYTFGKQLQADHRIDNWNTEEPLLYQVDPQSKAHEFAFSGVWDLPVGAGKAWLNTSNPVLSRLASNWKLDYILTYASGFPVAWPGLVNYCGTWSAANQNENAWFNNNKSCYGTLPPYTLRTTPDYFPNIVNPAAPQLNAAVEKAIPVHGERYRFVIRGEAFNLTNTAIRPGPDTNFNDAQFGQLPKKQQNFPRTLQLAAKFYF